MRAQTSCVLLALGLLLVPAADAGPLEGAWEDLQEPKHCPPIFDGNSLHPHCFCPLDQDPLGICDEPPQ